MTADAVWFHPVSPLRRARLAGVAAVVGAADAAGMAAVIEDRCSDPAGGRGVGAAGRRGFGAAGGRGIGAVGRRGIGAAGPFGHQDGAQVFGRLSSLSPLTSDPTGTSICV